MFMEVAIGAIGIGVILMVGFILVSQIRTALPTGQLTQYNNECAGHSPGDATFCNTSTVNCGPTTDNTSQFIYCTNREYTQGTGTVEVTIFAGLALVAVGIIVLAAFALINVFK